MAAGTTRWRGRTWVVVGLVTVAIGVAEGYVVRRQYDARQREVSDAWRSRLNQAAGDRGRLIGSWAAGLVADAQVVASYPSVVELVSASARGGAPTPAFTGRRAHVADIVGSFVRIQGFRGACLVDPDGRPIVVSGQSVTEDVIGRARGEVLAARGATVDLFLSGGQSVVVAASPVPTGTGAAAGLFLLFIDPSAWLYSQVLGDAFPGRSGENLLVREESGRAVLLSPARELVRPVPTHGFPSIPAPRPDGVMERDHRGVPVIAALRPIAGTPWAVLAKIDRAEVVDEFQRAARGGVLQSLTYIVLVFAIVFALLNHRQAIHAAEQLKAAAQIASLNRLLLTLLEANELMVREKDRQGLLEATCRIVVERAGFRAAWVGETQPAGRVHPVASAGAVDGYLEEIDVRYDATPAGRGPSGTAIRERRAVAVDDVASDPLMSLWREQALRRGYRSIASVPMVAGDRVFGVFVVYSTERGIFRGEALALLERLANDLAFVVGVMEEQARHRETEQVLVVREEQLRQAQKMEAVGRLAGGVAHDFNNLLMAISGYAELALSAKTDASRRERIEEIATAADRAAALTRQLLAFSRKQVLQPRVISLNTVVSEIEKMLGRLIGEDIELVTRLTPTLLNVLADPGQLEQVLVNLAVNARDAMPEGGRLVIETENAECGPDHPLADAELEAGSYVVLVVRDTGHGMAPEVLDHLFEPFFTTKDSGKGTGLGLSTVYGIVKQSGGAITVDSGTGLGTTFRIYLPTATAEMEALESSSVPVSPRAGGEHLLVVEDNRAVRTFVSEALTTAGYQVLDADSAESALELLASDERPIDLLLTDVVLPKMDGYDLSRHALARRPALRIIYMSGYVDSPRLRELALREGIDLIEKPFTSAAITARVAASLERVASEPNPGAHSN
jgi:signal transduction histidine kinase/ActR/RegA family two-component response regulator